MKNTTHKRKKRLILVTIVGLLIAYFPNFINVLFDVFNIPKPIAGPASAILWNWLAVGALATYIIFVERKHFDSIRLVKPNEKDIEWAFYLWGVAMVWFWLSSMLFPQESVNTGTTAITGLALPLVIVLIFTAAFTEEFLWRGYVIERIKTLTGKLWIGALFSFAVFLIPHITFFGPEWLLYHGIGTLVIYVHYLWRRNLWATMLLHLLINAPILIPTIFR